jgi:hypothetical protein
MTDKINLFPMQNQMINEVAKFIKQRGQNEENKLRIKEICRGKMQASGKLVAIGTITTKI